MRNPGWNHEQVWSASCDVKFNGVDFGPNLQYGKLKFLPAENRDQGLQIAGQPGVYDYSASPAGYPVPKNMKATLELFVVDALAWQTPAYVAELGRLTSPEGRFLGMIGAGKVRLDFINSNRFYLMAAIKVTKYDRFELGFNITLSLDAEPYWWEAEPQTMEWSFNASRVNLFDPSEITITPQTFEVTCTYEAAPGDPNSYRFELHAPFGMYASVTIPGLDPDKTYEFFCRNVYNKGSWYLYNELGNRIGTSFTGVETLTVRLVSRSSSAWLVGFRDVTLYDVTGAGLYSGEIETLDAPVRKLLYNSTQDVQIIVGEDVFDAPAGSDMEICGLNVPPRTTVPVTVAGDSGCRGYLQYQRGARSCTI